MDDETLEDGWLPGTPAGDTILRDYVDSAARYFTGVDGWGESDVDEIVGLLEHLHADRAFAVDLAAAGAAAMGSLTWESQITALLSAIA